MEQTTIDEFYERYTPIKNHFRHNASEDGHAFETFGPELDFVRSQYSNYIWTIIDSSGWYGVIAGYHIVDRIGYLITTEEWKDSGEQYVISDTAPLREEWESLPWKALEEIIGEDIGSVDDIEDVQNEFFYMWEEMDEQERDEILKKYKTN